jgi:hypothetical protein
MEKIKSIKRRGWEEETVETDRKNEGRKEDVDRVLVERGGGEGFQHAQDPL